MIAGKLELELELELVLVLVRVNVKYNSIRKSLKATQNQVDLHKVIRHTVWSLVFLSLRLLYITLHSESGHKRARVGPVV